MNPPPRFGRGFGGRGGGLGGGRQGFGGGGLLGGGRQGFGGGLGGGRQGFGSGFGGGRQGYGQYGYYDQGQGPYSDPRGGTVGGSRGFGGLGGGIGLPLGGGLAPVMKVLQKVSPKRASRASDTNRDAERPIPTDRKYANERRDGPSKRRHENA